MNPDPMQLHTECVALVHRTKKVRHMVLAKLDGGIDTDDESTGIADMDDEAIFTKILRFIQCRFCISLCD